jgi:hypothetical protein
MIFAMLVAASVVIGQATAGSQDDSDRDRSRLIGTWKLLSLERKTNQGDVSKPVGGDLIGRLMYDKAGRMSAQWMRRDRTVPPETSVLSTTPEAAREMLNGFDAYFGTFDVDESTRTVIHHVQGCVNPNVIGTDRRRVYKISGNQLILTAIENDSTFQIVWERLPD